MYHTLYARDVYAHTATITYAADRNYNINKIRERAPPRYICPYGLLYCDLDLRALSFRVVKLNISANVAVHIIVTYVLRSGHCVYTHRVSHEDLLVHAHSL